MTIKEKIYSYFANTPALKVLFVFDPMGLIQKDIEDDAQEWREDYIFHLFTGDWFGIKVKLTHEWADKKVILLFDHNVPEPNRADSKSCSAFPLMGVLEANMIFREQDEAAFMDQRHIPAAYSDFVGRHISELLREKFDKILSPYYGTPAFSFDLAHRAIISAYLDSTTLLEWYQIIARLIILSVKSPQKADAFFMRLVSSNNKVNAQDIAQSLNAKLMEICGQTFNSNKKIKLTAVAEALKYNAITQKLGVEAADPYKELKLTSLVQIQAVSKLLHSIRENDRLYAQFAPAFEELSANIHEKVIIDVYGADADYSYWSESMCAPIVAHIVDSSILSNPDYVVERLSVIKQHLGGESLLLKKVEFCLDVARYYSKRNAIGSMRLNKPDLYVKEYTSSLYLLDQSYRQSIASYSLLGLDEVSPKLEELKAELDQNYAAVTNELNLEWVRCLDEFGCGLRSVTGIQNQFAFYDANIKEKKVKVAVIVSDALRYELADELMERLQGKKHIATLTPALAMLPTETKYCKPSLLPHNSLKCTGTNLEVDGQVLSSTPLRTAQLRQFNENAVCIDHKELKSLSKSDARALFKNQIVYVFHNTIDEIGHNCTAKTFSSACEDALKELKELTLFIHDYANVTEVYITSDHGFLYNDQVFEEKDKQKVDEECIESKTRYYITTSNAPKAGITKFSLSTVSAMEGDYYVAVPLGTNRLAAPAGGYEFAHGGASLQELIIPIVYSKYKEKNEKEKVGVELLESTLHIVSSRLRVHLVQKEAVDMNRLERRVVCGLYRDSEPVSLIKSITLGSTESDPRLRTVELDFSLSIGSSGGILKFKVFDENDELNPLICVNVINSTLIEQDEF